MTPSDFDKLASHKIRIGLHYGKPLSEVPLSFIRWMMSDRFHGLSRTERDIIKEYIAELVRRGPTT